MQRGGSTAFVWLIWPCPSTRTPALGVRKLTILVDLSLVIITIYLMLFNIIFFNNVIWRFRFIYMYQPLNQMICRDVSYQHFHISSSVTGRLVIFINVWNGAQAWIVTKALLSLYWFLLTLNHMFWVHRSILDRWQSLRPSLSPSISKTNIDNPACTIFFTLFCFKQCNLNSVFLCIMR